MSALVDVRRARGAVWAGGRPRRRFVDGGRRRAGRARGCERRREDLAAECRCGVVRPAGGTVHVGGDDVTGRTPNQVVRRGLTQVPEGRQVFPSLAVEANLMLGAFGRSFGPRSSRRRFATFVGAARRANASSGSTPCCRSCTSCATAPQVERPAASSRWWQSDAHSWPSHARSRSTSSRSALPRSSSSSSSASCDRLNEEEHVAILLVEQNARLAFDLCERAYVLETGRIVLEGETRGYPRSPGGAAVPISGTAWTTTFRSSSSSVSQRDLCSRSSV